ncbi:hypothetical protein PRIC1_007936 [Phytophthora ramorum]
MPQKFFKVEAPVVRPHLIQAVLGCPRNFGSSCRAELLLGHQHGELRDDKKMRGAARIKVLDDATHTAQVGCRGDRQLIHTPACYCGHGGADICCSTGWGGTEPAAIQ